MERTGVEHWVAAYERSWRTPGTEHLAQLFAPNATYRPSPWANAVSGLDAIGRFWESERKGPDEAFEMASDVVAVEGNTAVVRVAVDYLQPPFPRWRDLWIIEFGDDGRCTAFEEWPFAPDQRDGHE